MSASYKSPFAPSTSKPGHGTITLALLPPNTPVLQTLSYQYPLKLVAPDPLPPPHSNNSTPHNGADIRDGNTRDPTLIHTVFLLTYGGGIVAGDAVKLDISIAGGCRLVLLTQGSTKIFKTPSPSLISKQYMNITLAPDSAIVYLPDPVQPFAHTAFEQRQIYNLEAGGGSLCVCDWVTSGRSARGENWDLYSYKSRNEVWSIPPSTTHSDQPAKKKRLLLRDNLILDENGMTGLPLAARMDNYSVFGTLILHGPIYASLSSFFLAEFESLPRIGGRNWGDDTIALELTPKEKWRKERVEREVKDGVIWSAASVREFVLVKFGSKDVEGSRNWLRDMIREDGTVLQHFGERAIMCLK